VVVGPKPEWIGACLLDISLSLSCGFNATVDTRRQFATLKFDGSGQRR
jgi:hypothetical protein